MNKLFTLLTSLGLGAGVMYFYDPNYGKRRRTLVSDKVNKTINDTDEAIDVALRDMRNRTRGVLAEMMGRLSDEGAPDWLIEERVRAELGRVVRHPGSIQVSADGGNISLRGPVLADEVERLVRRVGMVRGVKDVENQLDVHQQPGDIPGLQGKPEMSRLRPDFQQRNWSPTLRLLSGVGGGLLTLYGMTRRGLVGMLVGTAGLGLAARGVANVDLRNLVGMGSARDVIRINKAININAPVDRLYQFWSNFENLPRFMSHLREVKDLGNRRSHWVAAGPAGVDVEWDAITTRQVPNEVIAWESVEGSPVKTSGMVHFRSNPGGGSRINIIMNYTPPGGALGHAVAALFGKDPKTAMDEDLVRLKTLFEAGKTTVEGREISGRDIAAATS